MLSSNTGITVGYLAGKYPGRIGNLFGPIDTKGPYDFCPFALDNGAYACYTNGTEWSEANWLKFLQRIRMRNLKPLWALVPDVVVNREGTLERWHRYYPVVARHGWDAAFAVQDGMELSDVPQEASVIFVGGSTAWKWRTLPRWAKAFPRVHVGRVNVYRQLWRCHELGVESCDGTGCLKHDHGTDRPLHDLKAYLAEVAGERERHKQMELLIC